MIQQSVQPSLQKEDKQNVVFFPEWNAETAVYAVVSGINFILMRFDGKWFLYIFVVNQKYLINYL